MKQGIFVGHLVGAGAKKKRFRETVLKGRKETIDDFRLIAVKGKEI